MSISCGCDDDFAWHYTPPKDFSILQTKRSRRCCSCGCKLTPGSEVGEFERSRRAHNDIEERICGDDIPMASWYMCEECVGLFWALADIKYCIALRKGESMRDLVKVANGGEE